MRNNTKKEVKAKANQEKAVRERELQEKRIAALEKEKVEAFAAYTHQISDTPFVPPVEGWTHEASLGTSRWYIILPKTGFASNGHFSLDGSHYVLDCLGIEGRNDYVSVLNSNTRWYLLRTKKINMGEHATSIKDNGLTMCLRQAGCYRVLAVVRQEPTQLPDRLNIPLPANLTATYSSDDVSFDYPQNWFIQERKNKDNKLFK